MNAPLTINALPAEIAAAHEAAQKAHKSAVAHAVQAGLLLLCAKDEVPHGEWLAWINDNCKFSARTATGYMRLALLPRRKRQRVADLSLRQALDVLAEPRKKSLTAPKPEVQVEQGDVGGGEDHQHQQRPVLGPPCDGMQFARLAVLQLEQIRPDDSEKEQALAQVKRWIQDHDEADVAPRPLRQSRPARCAQAVEQAAGAVQELVDIQGEYQSWRENLPENLADGALAEKLDAVIDLDLQGAADALQEAEAAELPRGFGRD